MRVMVRATVCVEIAKARADVQRQIAKEANGVAPVKTHNALMLDRGCPTINFPVTAGAIYIARHLRIEASQAQIERAIELSSFGEAKAQERTHGYRERPEESTAFFREGRAGQWQDVLTPDQIARIVADHREQMARFGYLPDSRPGSR